MYTLSYRPLKFMHIRLRKHAGFSLLELMAVVTIALILTIVAVNSYSAMKQRRSLRSGAESVRDVLTNARSLAVSRNAWHRVVIQLRDPVTNNTSKTGFWIDEIDPGTSTNPNPITLDTATRALVVPWQGLPESVTIVDASIRGTSITAATANPYLVMRFMPNGSSDEANIRLRETSSATPTGQIDSEVRLFSATAKSKIVAARP
jgi:prepilin-type N-terminal cleavage/methylation domain-containing protein